MFPMGQPHPHPKGVRPSISQIFGTPISVSTRFDLEQQNLLW